MKVSDMQIAIERLLGERLVLRYYGALDEVAVDAPLTKAWHAEGQQELARSGATVQAAIELLWRSLTELPPDWFIVIRNGQRYVRWDGSDWVDIMLRTSAEWYKLHPEHDIIDHDGWRGDSGIPPTDWDTTRISENQYYLRVSVCTQHVLLPTDV
jgi:hypothetical protein